MASMFGHSVAFALRPQFDDITVRVNSEKIELAPGAKVAHQFMLYHGPVKAALLGAFALALVVRGVLRGPGGGIVEETPITGEQR